MADVIPFYRNATFDTDATRVMGEAFDRVCHTLYAPLTPDEIGT
jgi:hypothetical protein